MNRLHLIIVILCCMLLCACGHRYDARLTAIDSIIEDHADSARMLLEAYDTSDASTANRMYYYLLLADAANKCYDTLPSDSILQEVADFYDRHGTPNEQIRAHYLLGCVYRDMGEAPQALDC